MAFSDIRFAQPINTYVSPNFQELDKTGQILQRKYYENRDKADSLEQAVNSMEVEDKDIGVLNSVKAELNTQLSQVKDNWHRAGSIVRDAVKTVMNNDVLKGAIEDKQKRSTYFADLRKKTEDKNSGITLEAYNAAVILDQHYNNKPIQKDPVTGIVSNRWSANAVPTKPDTDKMLMDIIELRTKHPNSIGALLQRYPGIEGYLRSQTGQEVTGQELYNAAQAYINSRPEVKAYHNFINNAQTINRFSVAKEDGSFIMRDVTPADFRELGLSVNDDWTVKDQFIKDNKGNIKKDDKGNPIKVNLPQNVFFDAVRKAKENGEDVNSRLLSYYSAINTAHDLDNYADFASMFGYKNSTYDFIKDEAYFMDKKHAYDMKLSNQFSHMLSEPTSLVQMPDYDPAITDNNINQLNQQLKRMGKDSPEYAKTVAKINNIKNYEATIRRTALNDPEVKDWVDGQIDKLLENYKKDKGDTTGIPKKADGSVDREVFYKYFTGEGSLPANFVVNKRRSLINGQPRSWKTALSFPDIEMVKGDGLFGVDLRFKKEDDKAETEINDIRRSFLDKAKVKINKGALNATFGETKYVYKEGKNGTPTLDPIHQELASHVIGNASAIELPEFDKKGNALTLNDKMAELGINPSQYTAIVGFNKSTNGKNLGMVIEFSPKDKTLKDVSNKRINLGFNPLVSTGNQIEVLNYFAKKFPDSPEIFDLYRNNMSDIQFGNQFQDAYDAERRGAVVHDVLVEDLSIIKGKAPISGKVVVLDNNDNIVNANNVRQGNSNYHYGLIAVDPVTHIPYTPNGNIKAAIIAKGSTIDELKLGTFDYYTANSK